MTLPVVYFRAYYTKTSVHRESVTNTSCLSIGSVHRQFLFQFNLFLSLLHRSDPFQGKVPHLAFVLLVVCNVTRLQVVFSFSYNDASILDKAREAIS